MSGLLVVGKVNCHSCEVTCQALDEKGIQYEYVKQEDLPKEEWSKYRKVALSNKHMTMPILFKDSEYITLEEVIA